MSAVTSSVPRAEHKRRFLGLFGARSGELPLISEEPASLFAESFRLLALNIQATLAFEARKSVAVMSGYSADGRSLIAANLALALAEEHRVLLVEDRREERASAYSLDELLTSMHGLHADAVPAEMQRGAGDRHVGIRLLPRPQQAMEPDGLDATIAAASEAGTYTIIDTAPALSASAAFQDARLAGNALYVIRRSAKDIDSMRRVREQLERLNVNIIGVLLNEY